MATKNFIPSKDADFDLWQKNLVTQVNLFKTNWDLSTDAGTEWTLLTNTVGKKKKSWDASWAIVSTGNCLPSDKVTKTQDRKEYEYGHSDDPSDTSLRLYITRYIRNNPKVSVEEKRAMGIPVPDDTKTESHGTENVDVLREVTGSIKTNTRLCHDSLVVTPGVTSHAKGEGVDEIEVWIAIVEGNATAPPEPSAYSYDGDAKIGHYIRQFEEAQAGQKCYYKARKRFKGTPKTHGPFCLPWSGAIE